ncbi:hypothetical protein GQ457_06G022690 [Hibiscus cannabinus]
MAYTTSLTSHIHFHTNSRFFSTFPPKLPAKQKATATTAVIAASVTNLSALDSTIVALVGNKGTAKTIPIPTPTALIGGGSVAALAAVLSLTDPERQRRLQAEEVDGGNQEVTDDVNKVQLDIRLGHSKTVENVMKMLTDDGSLKGVTVCDAGYGTGCLAIPLAKEGVHHAICFHP